MKANIQLPVSMSTVGHQGPLIELYVYSWDIKGLWLNYMSTVGHQGPLIEL